MTTYKVQVRDAVYDEESEMMVCNFFLEEVGECRIVYFPKSDFHYKSPGIPVPDHEMHRTAAMFRGKKFKWLCHNDPNRNTDAETHPADMAKSFTEIIADQMEKISEGLSDPQRRMARKLGDVIERDLDKRRSMGDLLANEMLVRAQLRDIKFG